MIPPGQSSWQELSSHHDKAILVTGFLGGNANGATGDFSFGVQGQLLENGVPVQNISEMNITGNLLSFFHKLIDISDDPWQWSPIISPTLIFEQVQFSGS